MRDHTTASDGGLDKRVELFVAADSELQVTRGDSLHLQILAGVAGKLQNFGSKVLEDSGRVDSRRGSDSAVGADSALEESVDSSDRELQKKCHVC